MAASPVLADSSYYFQALSQGWDPLRSLALAAATRDLVVCGVVRCEVGRGLREARIRDRFHAAWNVMINVPADESLWAEVETLAWELDRKGVLMPVTDLVIACSARRVGAVVLTFDRHFSSIPGIRSVERLDV